MKRKMMARVAAVALVGVMAIGLAACGSKKEEAAGASSAAAEAASYKLVEDGKLHMATNAAVPPYEATTDDGGFEGIDVEIAGAIAKDLGLDLVVDDMDFTSVIAAVQGGKADIVMAGLTVTDERKQNIDFSDTYAKAVQVVIVPEGSDIKTVDDLDGKQIGCQDGTTGYMYASDQYGEDKVNSYQNGAMAVQALLANKVDAVIIDNQPAQKFVEKNEGLVILESAYADEDYAIGISKDNPELTKAINASLQKLTDDGTVQGIIDKYIPAEEASE